MPSSGEERALHKQLLRDLGDGLLLKATSEKINKNMGDKKGINSSIFT